MGSDHHYPEDAPAHRVRVGGFWIDRYPVTNAQFQEFVDATGHKSVAEQAPDPADYPVADPELLVAASTLFVQPTHRVDLRFPYEWWHFVPGTDWRHPRGPESNNHPDHPVVHVAWADVEAYATWAEKALPTEAEWEFAARGGLDGAEFAWGDEFMPNGQHLANTWHGEFPVHNQTPDGFERTAPVGSFPANGYGLHDMIGNVWEWTEDWFAEHTATMHACCAVDNPRGGALERSYEAGEFAQGMRIPRKVIKGGSHLCAPNYCRRYRPAARMPQNIDTSVSHLGFRCIVRSTD